MPFENEDPTTEVMAHVIHEVFHRRLTEYAAQAGTRNSVRPGVRVSSVKVWETATSWAEYFPPAPATISIPPPK